MKSMKPAKSHSLIDRGFSMVEALVALVVLGAGLLGIASLYVVTLQTSGSAIYRTQAVNLASDIADRIRANRLARAAYAGSPASSGDTCTLNACDAAQMAAHDLYWWQRQIAETLPGNPTGTIDVSGTGETRTYTITITWAEPGQDDPDGENRQFYVLRMQI
jgi:type IV pilus assembly protein PilV